MPCSRNRGAGRQNSWEFSLSLENGSLSMKGMKESGKKLVRKEKELEALYNVIALVTQGGNLRTIYSRIAATVSKFTRFPVVAIERYVPDEDILEIVGQCGLLPEGKAGVLRVP